MKEGLRVLVIGSGGREHALAWSLSHSPSVDFVHVCPGNGGTALTSATSDDDSAILNFDIPVDDFTGLVSHARKHGINLVVPGPEAPLVAGICSYFQAVGIRCFGPSKAAARMEGSKAHAKDFMQRHGIPTALFRSFSDYDEAKRYLDSVGHEVVIKADGLAAGKGVIIPKSKGEAQKALKEMMVDRQFGTAGDEVVIEEFLEGEELSVLTFSDGYTIKSLPPAQDHKRIFDGDRGPNTGGMGCYAPTKVASQDLMAEINRTILQPTIDYMRRDGHPFVGLLFTGLMITKSGPKVIEYNVRFGDPEIQTLLPLLSKDTDLARVMVACTEHWLDGVELKVEPKFSATVVASAEGYPGSYAKHRPMKFDPVPKDTYIFHAGTELDKNKKLVTSGGRVIAATATAPTLEEAVAKAYKGIKTIHFEGMYYRTDIAHRAFKATTTTTSSADAKPASPTHPSNPNHTNDNQNTPLTYASVGVSIPAGNALVERIKPLIASTSRPGSLNITIGGFGGTFDLNSANLSLPPLAPTLVAAIDGVGTKLKIAFAMGKHDTVGIDLVAMNVNDLIVQGAEPVLFLDAFTASKLDVEVAAEFVSGVASGCREAGCALVGGETAEMPGLLVGNEYDVIGAAVGVVDTRGGLAEEEGGSRILPDTAAMVPGDVLLALASSGCHSNGYSLIRAIVAREHLSYSDPAPWDAATSVGLSLLTPTRIYVRSLLPLLRRRRPGLVKGLAHITGGGLTENVPRMLPRRLAAQIDLATFTRPAVFEWLQRVGRVRAEEMATAFNNGIGMVLVVSEAASAEVMARLQEAGETVFRVGSLVERKEGGQACVLLNLDSWDTSSTKGGGD